MHPEQAREVQDSARQGLVLSHCGLTPIIGRMAPADACDTSGNPYELKSATRQGVTTARDVGLHTVAGWRRKYWIIAVGRNLASGFTMDALYIAHPDDLEPFFCKLEGRLEADWGTCNTVLEAARAAHVTAETIDRAREICRRGITVNNPKIPLALVEQNATRLDHRRASTARTQIRKFVRSRPLCLPEKQ